MNDRRVSSRHFFAPPRTCGLFAADGQSLGTVTALNISTSGLVFQAAQRLEPGDRVSIAILGVSSTRSRCLQLRIVYVNRQPDSYQVGGQFLQPLPAPAVSDLAAEPAPGS